MSKQPGKNGRPKLNAGEKTVAINVPVSEGLRDTIKAKAKLAGRSMASLVREAIEAYF